MRASLIASLAACVLLIAACAGPGAGFSQSLTARSAGLPTLPDLQGNEVPLSALVKDPAASYLLLVNSHSQCDVTPKFMNDLCKVWNDFEALKCRCALVVLEKEGAPAEIWKEFARPHITLLRDPGGKCLNKYAKKKIPSLTLIDQSEKAVFHCEGYLAPETLADKIKKGDFSEVKAKGG